MTDKLSFARLKTKINNMSWIPFLVKSEQKKQIKILLNACKQHLIAESINFNLKDFVLYFEGVCVCVCFASLKKFLYQYQPHIHNHSMLARNIDIKIVFILIWNLVLFFRSFFLPSVSRELLSQTKWHKKCYWANGEPERMNALVMGTFATI